MTWLDLGWLKRGEAWEFHPWGPFSRGYRLTPGQALHTRNRMRGLRFGMVVLGLALLAGWWVMRRWDWVLMGTGLGLAAEAGLTWWVVRELERDAAALGWENGLHYLVRWVTPKLLVLARMGSVVVLGLGLWLVLQLPTAPKPYLVVGSAIAVQHFLNYLKQVSE